jgi:hypothetical protein
VESSGKTLSLSDTVNVFSGSDSASPVNGWRGSYASDSGHRDGRAGASAQSQRKGAIAPCSWKPEESQVESCEHQDNANIHCQPFPESVFEEHEIYTNYDGCHRHHVKHDSYLSVHLCPLHLAGHHRHFAVQKK